MATQNLFEKYGIKEVADVTFYRIEKKEETYESKRQINISSVLKGAVELKTVYPIEDGVGSTEGFQAYVFTDADIITGVNYDCDDTINVKVTVKGSYIAPDTEKVSGEFPATLTKTSLSLSSFEQVGSEYSLDKNYPKIIDTDNNKNYEVDELVENGYDNIKEKGLGNITLTRVRDTNKYTFFTTVSYTLENSEEQSYGITSGTATQSDPDKIPGTHEFSYAQQAFMLFAKRQNLITKTGTRYKFTGLKELMGDLIFEDRYTLTPEGTEKTVVLGIANSNTTDEPSWDENLYDIEEVNNSLKSLTQHIEAKAYDVTYSDYAELTVADEMGYFNPYFLGTNYNKNTGTITPFIKEGNAENFVGKNYIEYAQARKGVDNAIAQAKMWGDGTHFSINDAIDALRQQKKLIDTGDSSAIAGIKNLFGGYKVSHDIGKNKAINKVGEDDTVNGALYNYNDNGTESKKSEYPLKNVINTISSLKATDKEIRVTAVDNKTSNRAIFVKNATTNISASAFIYLLHNKAYKRLLADTEGVFSFSDKAGNTLLYQDKIFAGVEWLALVVVGDQGMIFVANRCGKTNASRVAWLVNEGGYIDNSRAKMIVANGLVHTTDVTINDETFEATCAVYDMKIRKITKRTNHYTPVLFLDTLKVSTIEQSAEEVYATGGKGNANLIGWDYGKTITLNLQDALFTPASMSAIFAGGTDFKSGVKEAKMIDRMEKVIAKRSFVVPAGNSNGTPTEADTSAQAVFYDPNTMQPYPDGTPIAEGESFLKFTRSVAYENASIGHQIEISADKFPGTYKIVGDTWVRSKETGEDERFQFVVQQAKMQSSQTITLEAEGDPAVKILSNAAVKIA